jgi:superfamily II DNA or RNA helicase
MHQIVSKVLLRSFFKIQPDYIIGLSATPRRPKNDPYQKAISWFFGNVVVGKELFKKHTVYSVETNFTPNEIKYTPKGVDWTHILRSQAQDNNRNTLIADIVMRFPNRIWLILVKLVEHATRLKAIFNSHNIVCETLTGSKTEFDRDCKILIGTTSKIGVGFDHAPIDALFVAADVVEYFEQFLGRCMRKVDNDPIVFDLDDTYSILHRHFEGRLKKYKKHGGIIFENIDLNEITDDDEN